MQPSLGIVVVTRDRREELVATLQRVERLWAAAGCEPPAVPVVIVDNASSDGSADAVRQRFEWCEVVGLAENRGAAGRTVGAARLDTDVVAFADDDSWWPPASLARALDHFRRCPELGLLAGRVLVGPDQRLDPVCAEMAASPYRPPPGTELPGPAVLGFVACGAVVRRAAFLAVGGFHPRYGVGGEESLLALDLTAAGWGCAYVEHVVAHHHPSPSRDPGRRRSVMARNDVWTTLLRRPLPVLAAQLDRLGEAARHDEAIAVGLREALAAVEDLWPERRSLPAWLEAQLA